MNLKKNQQIPDGNHLLRHIRPNKLIRDDNGKVIRILPQAFLRREGESDLSANWLEYFQGNYHERINYVIQEFRNCFDVKAKSEFVIGKVEEIKALCAENRKQKTLIIYSPTPKIKSHVTIHHWPDDDLELLDQLAGEVWCDLVRNIS